MLALEIVCPSCGIPFTRNGRTDRSSDFYNTRAQNDTCIVCREGLDPDTLEPLATKGRTMDGEKLLADIEDALRNMLPNVHPTSRRAVAFEVRRRIAVTGVGFEPMAATSAIMRASAMVPFCRCGRPMWHHTDPGRVGDCREYLPVARSRPTCDCDPVDVGAAGRRVLDAAARGDRDYGTPPTLAGEPGEILGKARNVVVHPDGRLTFDMEVNDAGAKFIGQIRRAEPTGPLPPIERPPAPGSMSCEHGRRRYTSNGPARCSGGFTEAKCRCYPTARTRIRTWARGVLDTIKGANRGE